MEEAVLAKQLRVEAAYNEAFIFLFGLESHPAPFLMEAYNEALEDIAWMEGDGEGP